MSSKLLQGISIVALIVLLPILGKPEALSAVKWWILILIGIVANVFQPHHDAFERSAPAADRGTAAQILWSIYLTQALAVIEAVYVRYPDSLRWDGVNTAAFVMMLLGLTLRTWAIVTLGQWFTWHITAQPGQRLVCHGPYRLMRHPGYVGAWLTYVFSPVFLHAWGAAVVGLITLTLAFSRRVYYEEALLKACLGETYESYCRKVPRFIPGISWSPSKRTGTSIMPNRVFIDTISDQIGRAA